MKRQQHNFQRFASSIKNTSNNSSHTHTTYNSVQSTTTTTTGQESPIPMTFFASANTAAAAAAATAATATAARLADNQSARELQQFLARANNVLASLGKGCLEESLKDERIRKETNKFLSGAQQSVGRYVCLLLLSCCGHPNVIGPVLTSISHLSQVDSDDCQ